MPELTGLTESEQLLHEVQRVARETAEEVARDAAEQAVRTALQDIPAREEVSGMIKAALDAQAASFHNMLDSVDQHLRNVESALGGGLAKVENAALRISATAEIVESQLSGIREDVSNLREDVDGHERRLVIAEGVNETLNATLFGDPKRLDGPKSVFGRLDDVDEAFRRQTMAITDLRNTIMQEITPLASWVNAQKKIWNIVWQNKYVRYTVISTLLGMTGFNFLNNISDLLKGG